MVDPGWGHEYENVDVEAEERTPCRTSRKSRFQASPRFLVTYNDNTEDPFVKLLYNAEKL